MSYRISDANIGILERRKSVADVGELAAPQIEMLEDLVDYGTQLLVRCLPSASTESSLTDSVVLPILTRHFLEVLDGAHVLLASGCAHTSWLQLRAMFEVSTYIRWILLADSDLRSRVFYVAHIRHRLEWAKRVRRGTPEREAFIDALPGLDPPVLPDDPEVLESAEREWSEIQEKLALPHVEPINQEFIRLRGTKSFDPHWYQVVYRSRRRKSLRTLVIEIDRLPAYTLIYQKASEVMHAGAAASRNRVGDGVMEIGHLRDLRGFGEVWMYISGEAIGLYRSLINQYRPDEAERFSAVYRERWQQLYLQRLEFNYAAE